MKQAEIPFKRTYYRFATVGEVLKQLTVHHRIVAREMFGSPKFDIHCMDREARFWFSGHYKDRKDWYDLIDSYVKTMIEYEQ
jgi:hypothetical protein